MLFLQTPWQRCEALLRQHVRQVLPRGLRSQVRHGPVRVAGVPLPAALLHRLLHGQGHPQSKQRWERGGGAQIAATVNRTAPSETQRAAGNEGFLLNGVIN